MLEQHVKALVPTDIPTVIGDLPGTTVNIVAMSLYDGGASVEYFGPMTTFYPIVKFVARHESYEIMRTWIESIQEAFHQYTDDYFMSIHMVGYPLYLGKDEHKLHEMQIVFRLSIKE